MRIARPLLIAVALVAVGCGADVPAPTASPTPTLALQPLPANLSGIPGPTDVTALLVPHTPRGELEVGVSRNFTLGHCGLMSPVDVDGSLWDPVGGHNGAGGPLNEQQSGELINETPAVVELTDPNTMVMRTAGGAVITLTRHDGPRNYYLCD